MHADSAILDRRARADRFHPSAPPEFAFAVHEEVSEIVKIARASADNPFW